MVISDLPVVLCELPDCDKPVGYKSGGKPRRFCSVSHARTKYPPQLCQLPDCGKTFRWRGSSHANSNRYCSAACRDTAHQNRETRVCRRCGNDFEVRVSRTRVYCSDECSGRGSQVLPCQRPGCTNTRRVFVSALRKPGAGKYCSIECRAIGRATPVQTVVCAGCQAAFTARDGRRYHSLTCYRSTLRSRAQCHRPGCRRPRLGNARFCTLECARKAQRRRSANPRIQERNARIRELAITGKPPKEIALELLVNGAGVPLAKAYATVRQVLHQPVPITKRRSRS